MEYSISFFFLQRTWMASFLIWQPHSHISFPFRRCTWYRKVHTCGSHWRFPRMQPHVVLVSVQILVIAWPFCIDQAEDHRNLILHHHAQDFSSFQWRMRGCGLFGLWHRSLKPNGFHLCFNVDPFMSIMSIFGSGLVSTVLYTGLGFFGMNLHSFWWWLPAFDSVWARRFWRALFSSL